MYLPTLDEVQTSRSMVSDFKGYNHNLVIGDSELYDTTNMTLDFYPALSPRAKRGKVLTFAGTPYGLISKEYLAWVDGTGFYYNNVLKGMVAASEKKMVVMGAYILIFPDKKYYNTETGVFGDLENTVVAAGTKTFTLSKADGTSYAGYTVAATAPASPADGALWLNTSLTPNTLNQWSESMSMWTPVATTFVKIAGTGIGTGFKEGDGVTISGCTDNDFNVSTIIKAYAADYIVIPGILDVTFTQTADLTVKRAVPDMDYVTQLDNRCWGCSSTKHEIYSCKLGDPFNWNVFAGIASDSYAVTVGSEGDFTGAIAHLGYVLFFKENCIHKIYGTKPANFQITTSEVRGVEKGSEKSLVIVNETLYYKSRNGICAYEGALPSSISDNLGPERYTNAVAGGLGNKYYISMKKSNGYYDLFVYDEKKGAWIREDGVSVKAFSRNGNELYFIKTDGTLWTVTGQRGLYDGASTLAGSTSETSLFSEMETGIIGLNMPDNKYVSKLQLRLSLDAGTSIDIYVQYDSSGTWVHKQNITASALKSFTLPIIPNRCDHMKIRVCGLGTGSFKVYSIAKVVEGGSEL